MYNMYVLRIQSKRLVPGGTCMPLDTCSIRMPQRGSIMEQNCTGEDMWKMLRNLTTFQSLHFLYAYV